MRNKWKWIILLVLVFAAACKKTAKNSKTKFFVVRHAERYPGFDGALTWAGKTRAGDLMRLLQDSGISKIYVTPYVRTAQTADSLRIKLKLDTVQYTPDSTGDNLLRQINQHHDYGTNILIVGHGNTVPHILRKLGANYPGDNLPDTVYDKIFEVINNHGKVTMKTMQYGVHSDTSQSSTPRISM